MYFALSAGSSCLESVRWEPSSRCALVAGAICSKEGVRWDGRRLVSMVLGWSRELDWPKGRVGRYVGGVAWAK